jgi:hypothetical protein
LTGTPQSITITFTFTRHAVHLKAVSKVTSVCIVWPGWFPRRRRRGQRVMGGRRCTGRFAVGARAAPRARGDHSACACLPGAGLPSCRSQAKPAPGAGRRYVFFSPSLRAFMPPPVLGNRPRLSDPPTSSLGHEKKGIEDRRLPSAHSRGSAAPMLAPRLRPRCPGRVLRLIATPYLVDLA